MPRKGSSVRALVGCRVLALVTVRNIVCVVDRTLILVCVCVSACTRNWRLSWVPSRC